MNKKFIYFRYLKICQKHITIVTKKDNLKLISKERYKKNDKELRKLIPKNFFIRLFNESCINEKEYNKIKPITKPDVISSKHIK